MRQKKPLRLYLPPAGFKIVGVLLLAAACGLLFVRQSRRERPIMAEESFYAESAPQGIVVHVSGAVAQPDRLYELPEGSRVMDAVVAAGGPLADADLSRINLAQFLKDGQKLYVPFRAAEGDSRINLNTADQAALESLPGIGAGLAARIIAYRESEGPFASPEELLNVSGIGEKLLAALKELVTV